MQHNQNDNFYLQEAFTKLKLLNDCIWLRIVPGFLFITSAISSPLIDLPFDDWYKFIKVCKISFWTDVNMFIPHLLNNILIYVKTIL